MRHIFTVVISGHVCLVCELPIYTSALYINRQSYLNSQSHYPVRSELGDLSQERLAECQLLVEKASPSF